MINDNYILLVVFLGAICALFAAGSLACEIIERRERRKYQSKYFNYDV